MAARRRDLERATGGFLATNGAEIVLAGRALGRFGSLRFDFGQGCVAVQPARDCAHVGGTVNRNPVDEHGLLATSFGDDRVAEPGVLGASKQREHTPDGAELTGERQLPD